MNTEVEYEIEKLKEDMLAKKLDDLSFLSAEYIYKTLGPETPGWVLSIAGGNREKPDNVADAAAGFYLADLVEEV
jgi:hypothetical protein